jgi:hypothetical protein
MNRPLIRTVVRVLVAVGIILTLMLAGAAPSEFPHGHATPIGSAM